MIRLSDTLMIPSDELEFSAIRAQGAGGQHVNKTSSAVQLRFDVRASSLPIDCQQLVLKHPDQRISGQGVIVIKSQSHRSQEKNREEAKQRLESLLKRILTRQKPRKATRPSKSSVKKRLESKQQRGKLKNSRRRVDSSD